MARMLRTGRQRKAGTISVTIVMPAVSIPWGPHYGGQRGNVVVLLLIIWKAQLLGVDFNKLHSGSDTLLHDLFH
jgi:hypothetical protein